MIALSNVMFKVISFSQPNIIVASNEVLILKHNKGTDNYSNV